MNLHLAEIAQAVAPGAHAVLLLDQAGWHLSDKLVVPPNITLLPLPPKCPELNPAENEPRRVSRRLRLLRGWSHGNQEDSEELRA
jgi:transposase